MIKAMVELVEADLIHPMKEVEEMIGTTINQRTRGVARKGLVLRDLHPTRVGKVVLDRVPEISDVDVDIPLHLAHRLDLDLETRKAGQE